MSAHAHSEDDHGSEGHDFAHPMSVQTLLAVFFALTFLTVITVAQASFDFGAFEVATVMFIATIKAVLVMAFFMHMIADKPFNAIIFIGSFVFVGLFVIFTLGDSMMTSGSFEPVVEELAPAVAEPMEVKVDGAP
jgi:cytochrome c oxidase subunit 4